MSLLSQLRRWFHRSVERSLNVAAAARRHGPKYRPQLEFLEERLQPSATIAKVAGGVPVVQTAGLIAYNLTSDGTLTKTTLEGTVTLDSGVNSFKTAGSDLYDLKDNGQLWRYDGADWNLVDVGVATFGVDGADANVYALEANGNLRAYYPGLALTSTPVAGIRSMAVNGDGSLFYLDSAGNLSGLAGMIDSTVTSFQLDGAGNLYELLANGNLYKTNTQTTPLATNVASFHVTSNGQVDTLGTDGVLQKDGVTVGRGATSFQVSDTGQIYFLSGDTLMREGQVGVDIGVRSFALSSTGAIYELGTDGNLGTWSGGRFGPSLDSSVQAFAVAANGALYELKGTPGTAGALYSYTSAGWTLLDTDVTSFVLLQGGSVVELKQGGGVWQHSVAGGWSNWDQGVSSITLGAAPFQVQVVDAGGTRTLDAISRSNSPDFNFYSFYDLLADGTLWQYGDYTTQFAGAGWILLDSDVTAFSLSANHTLVELEKSGGLWIHGTDGWSQLADGVASYSLQDNQLVTYGAAGARQFTFTSDGTYGWSSDGNLYLFKGGVTTLVDSGVSSVVVTVNGVYVLKDSGELWGHYKGSRFFVDFNVASFGTTSGQTLYILECNGNLRQYAEGGLSDTPMATGVQSMAVPRGGFVDVFFLDSAGTLFQYDGIKISVADTGVSSFQVDGSGNLYELLTTGNVYKGNSASTPLATGVAKFHVTSDGTVYTLTQGGTLQQNAGTTVGTTGAVADFQVARDGTLYYLSGGSLFQAGVATPLDSGVTSFSASGDGFVYELKASGDLVRRLGAAAVTLDTSIQAFNVSSTGAVFEIETSGAQLWRYTVAGWSFLDSGVQSFVLPQGSGVLDLEANGQVWLNTMSLGWKQLASDATALALGGAPYQVQVTDAGGTHVLNTIDMALSGRTAAYELLANGLLVWNQNGGGWSSFDGGVITIGLATDDTFLELKANGDLFSYTPASADLGPHGVGTWTLLDVHVTSFVIAGTTVTTTDGSPMGQTTITV